MASVEVFNGDLEGALNYFKNSMEKEGTVNQYKRRQAFSSPAEVRRYKKHSAELRQKARQRKKLRDQQRKQQSGRD